MTLWKCGESGPARQQGKSASINAQANTHKLGAGFLRRLTLNN